MKINLAKSVKLDTVYTNHSIQSTVITTLDRDGFEARHIIQLSSHKSESTVKEYAPKCTDSKRKEMFESLSNAMLPPPKKKIPVTSAKTTTYDTDYDIQNVKENLPNFDLNPLDTDTIDDNMLVSILNEFENPNTNNNNNSNSNDSANDKNVLPLTVLQSNQQFNTQVINQNIPVRTQMSRIPAMYFPNSTNVTINYNFSK